MTLLEFMGEHPYLTFFLAVIAASLPVQIIKALRGQRDDDAS